MENYEIVEVPNMAGELVKHVIIDRGDGNFTSMPKSVWDELEAAKKASGTLS